MTAGHGVSHAEEAPASYRGGYHGVQLWVAQPEVTRHGPAAFEHHPELPQLEVDRTLATVLVGELAGTVSPARADTPLMGADLRVGSGATTLPLEAGHEHALVVLAGSLTVDGLPLAPGTLGYLEPGRDQLDLVATDEARLLLLGGVPFESSIVMWWNFVGRSHDEMVVATTAWNEASDRFGTTASSLARIPAPRTPWDPPPA
jgi:redox-sensitive bicupin YhaK (pirin superfamily)